MKTRENCGNKLPTVAPFLEHNLNPIQPELLRGKVEGAGVEEQLTAWTIDYLTNRPHYIRLHDCVSEVIVCSTVDVLGAN